MVILVQRINDFGTVKDRDGFISQVPGGRSLFMHAGIDLAQENVTLLLFRNTSL